MPSRESPESPSSRLPLILGSAAFGLDYGISNKAGRVSDEALSELLIRAAGSGVLALDTAQAYGDAEARLQRHPAARHFPIITKTMRLAHGLEAVKAHIDQATSGFGRSLRAILVHSAADLHHADGVALWEHLQQVKASGAVSQIGISAYPADDPAALCARFKPDILQIPLNILDQRLIRDGSLARIKALNCAVHARSAFLQGALFLSPVALAQRGLAGLAPSVARLQAAGDVVALALQFLGGLWAQGLVEAVVVGATKVAELDDILVRKSPILADHHDWATFAADSGAPLDPYAWPQIPVVGGAETTR